MAGSAAARPEGSAPVVPWGARLAGGLLVAVGVLNAAFGVLSLTTTLVRLAQDAAGGLVVAGTLTAVAGWLVWRGSRKTAIVALVAFAWLFVIQIVDVARDGGPGVASGGMTGRFAVLVLIIAALAVATRQLRSGAPRRQPG